MDNEGLIPVEEFAEKADRDVDKIIVMTREGFCSGRLVDGKWYIDPNDLVKFINKNEPEPEEGKAYIILENGKKHYVKATVIDIIFSLILPFWGLVIGLVAIARGEKKRGQTMALIGVVGLLIFAAMRA